MKKVRRKTRTEKRRKLKENGSAVIQAVIGEEEEQARNPVVVLVRETHTVLADDLRKDQEDPQRLATRDPRDLPDGEVVPENGKNMIHTDDEDPEVEKSLIRRSYWRLPRRKEQK